MTHEIILITVCKDGFYNSTCMDNCGQCMNENACDKHSGECHNGCQLHFQSPFCKGMIRRRQQYLKAEFMNL